MSSREAQAAWAYNMIVNQKDLISGYCYSTRLVSDNIIRYEAVSKTSS